MSSSTSNFTLTLVELATTWVVQSTLLLIVGLTIAACLRRFGPAFQSVVYRVTLCAVLLCPIVTQVFAAAGLSLLTFDLQSQAKRNPIDSTYSQQQASLEPNEHKHTSLDLPSTTAPLVSNELANKQPAITSQVEVTHDAKVYSNEESSTQPPVNSDATSLNRFALSFPVVMGLLTVWVAGSIWFGVKIVLDWLSTDSLRRKSHPSEEMAAQVCSDIAMQLGVKPPRVLSTPFLNSPCLFGHLRPVVLVPEETEQSTYPQVFLHELAHLRRADWLWNLIGRITHALIWFQPFAWILVRRNAAVAEDVCDDYVLEHGCNREGYVSQLLEIAERSLPQAAIAGVSMVGFRSTLGRRAHRILDTTRALSTRASRRFACCAFAVTLAMTLSVGSVYLASPRIAEADGLNVTPSQDSPETEKVDHDSDIVQASGVVLGPDGKPVEGATVCFVNWLLAENNVHRPLSETTTDASGHFQLAFRKSSINRNIGQADQWKNTILAVRKPGYGPDSITYRNMKDPSDLSLQLVEDDVPIEGQIVDLEGQPIAGVSIKVLSIAVPKTDLSGWIESVKNGEDLYHSYSQHIDRSFPNVVNRDIKTDQDGRFRINNLGRDRVVSLTVQGPTVAYSNFRVMTRLHDPITRETGTFFPKKETTYGAQFRRTAAPTQVIRGIVRDAETKQPLAGVGVESWMFAGTRLAANRVLRTESDSEGKFELAGMPKGDGNVILANPRDGQPYLMREIEIPNKVGLGPVDVDVELNRGVVIRGRITDKKTGEPVIARLHYLPFTDNEFAIATPEFDDNQNTNGYQTRYESKPDGTYELIGLPGRAIIGVQAIGRAYRRGVGSESIEGANEHGHFNTYNNPIMASTKWPNLLVEVDLPADTKTHELDAELDPGESVSIEVVDTQQIPIIGVTTDGLMPSGYEGPQHEARFDVIGLSPNETRTVVLHHKERNIGQVVRVGGTDALRTIKLESCAKVKGQLLDEDGDPLPGVGLRTHVLPFGDFGKSLPPSSTDRFGRFEITLIPGTKYAIDAQGPKIRFKTVIRELAIQPGETKDLGPMKLKGREFVQMLDSQTKTSGESDSSKLEERIAQTE